MALTIKHLNGDSSFLLTFEPVVSATAAPFRILLDPWITGSSTIFHSKISVSTHKAPACISSLRELPVPDLVVISQHKSDHCNEPTLRQLPPSGTKTLILAEPASARVIKSWKHFDREKVRTIPKWDDATAPCRRDAVVRIPVPSLVPGGEPGEVTVAFIPQRRDLSGLHSAIGITYRPPPSTSAAVTALGPALVRHAFLSPRSASPALAAAAAAAAVASSILSPPETPTSYRSAAFPPAQPPPPPPPPPSQYGLPPTPTSLRSSRSTSSLKLSRQLSMLSTPPAARSLSLLYSPHGISTSSLSSYAKGHLAPEAALPLTALLHCFDAVSNPWWLGGNVLLGAPAGLETAAALGARAWVSAHDGEKELRGIATAMLKTKRYRRENIVEATVSPALRHHMMPRDGSARTSSSSAGRSSRNTSRSSSRAPSAAGSRHGSVAAADAGRRPTEVLALGIGEQVVISNDGVWNSDAPPPPQPTWAPPPPPPVLPELPFDPPLTPMSEDGFAHIRYDGKKIPAISVVDQDNIRES